MLHLDLLERQFSQHLIFRLRVRLSLKVRLKSDPDGESLPGIAVDEETVMRIVKMKESDLRLRILVGEASERG